MSDATATLARPDSSRFSDILLAMGVMAIIALMVLRLPVIVIDALVAVNIAAGVALLLMALYTPQPVAFSSFPSVLLISTLFRLALSVATTRLILLDADAGNIIDAFGNFVAGGNLVVGVVVFVIITAVQFIVIAKGAERVAEVAARFTLDAMPGKQLSIDSDLRSGLIDKDEARTRRVLLEKESQLNGALDGAMKFVKGDAIASIIIVIVNLLGGLTVGVLQHGMSVGTAAEVFSILTIGDGMVAQIPALLSAMAAGLVVTRSSSSGGGSHLGATIGRQICRQPRVLLLTGVVSLLFSAVPGFPTMVFIALAIAMIAVGHYADPTLIARLVGRTPSLALQDIDEVSGEQGASVNVDPTPPVSVSLPPGIARVPDLSGRVQHAIEVLARRSGVPFPVPQLMASRKNDEQIRVFIYDVEICTVDMDAPVPDQSLLDGVLPKAPDDGHGDDSRLGETNDHDAVAARVVCTVAECLREHIDRFLGVQETSGLIEDAARRYPVLVKEVLQVLTMQQIAEVLRNLLREDIPIRNMRDILEALAEWGGRERELGALTEFVRMGLSQFISRRYAGPDRSLVAAVLSGATEAWLRNALQETPAGIMLMLDPERLGGLREAVLEAFGDSAVTPVLLTSADMRRHLRRAVQSHVPGLAVLSYQELDPQVSVAASATIDLPETES